jgi:hypothetical protein
MQMSRRAAVNTADGFVMSAEAYERMKGAMLELAMRDNKNEAAVMRIAKAGEITEVTKHLTTMRNYAKKQGLVRAPKPPKDGSKGKRASRKRTPADTARDVTGL